MSELTYESFCDIAKSMDDIKFSTIDMEYLYKRTSVMPSEFMTWFDGVCKIIRKYPNLWTEKKIYGFITLKESTELIKDGKVGATLIRFSEYNDPQLRINIKMGNGKLIEYKIENTEQEASKILKYFPHIQFIYCRDGTILEMVKEPVKVVMTHNGEEATAKFDENGKIYSITGAENWKLNP